MKKPNVHKLHARNAKQTITCAIKIHAFQSLLTMTSATPIQQRTYSSSSTSHHKATTKSALASPIRLREKPTDCSPSHTPVSHTYMARIAENQNPPNSSVPSPLP